MRKPKLANVNGIVALAYLALIPVGAYVVYRKVQIIDEDLTALWSAAQMPDAKPRPIIDVDKVKRFFNYKMG